jgi:DNA-directed RNA polymerase specialized sigma24 family protein
MKSNGERAHGNRRATVGYTTRVTRNPPACTEGYMGTENPADQLRSSKNEPDAFGGFYDAHFEGLLGYLTRLTCDAEAGLDLTAETFAQAFLTRQRFRGTTDAEAAAWLYRIAKRQLARYFKQSTRRASASGSTA